MPLPTSINDLSTTPDSNFPAGTEAPDVLDNVIREHAAYIAQLRDGKLSSADLASTAAGKGDEMVATDEHTFTTLAQALAAIDWAKQQAGGVNVLNYIPPAQWAAILAGTSTYDASADVQSAISASITGLKKRLFFPDGLVCLNSAITVPPYYSGSMPTELVASNGTDFEIDFGRCHIKCGLAAGQTLFTVSSAAYPQTRYGLNIKGGSWSFTNAVEDVFKFTGNQMWMCSFDGMQFLNGSPVNIFSVSLDSASYEPGTFSFRNITAKANNLLNIKDGGGALKFVDNFTFDNIYFFGLSDSGAVIYMASGCGLYNSRLSKIVQVGKGAIVTSPSGGGFMSFCELSGLYSETTTNNKALINGALQNCKLVSGRASINNTSTQTVNWYNGLANATSFDGLHITNVAGGGSKPYSSESYAYYPVLVLADNSRSNTIAGYTRGEYYNAVKARNGSVLGAPTVTDEQMLTVFSYTGTTINTTGFVQAGSSIPQVGYLGTNFMLDVELSGVAFTAGTKTLAVEVRIGASTIRIGADISAGTDVWSARGRLFFRKSGSNFNVFLGFGQSWAGNTPAALRVGTPDVSGVTVAETDALTFGLNVKAITGGVVITDGSVKMAQRFGIFDALV